MFSNCYAEGDVQCGTVQWNRIVTYFERLRCSLVSSFRLHSADRVRVFSSPFSASFYLEDLRIWVLCWWRRSMSAWHFAREGLEPDAVLTCPSSPLGGSGDSAGSPPNNHPWRHLRRHLRRHLTRHLTRHLRRRGCGGSWILIGAGTDGIEKRSPKAFSTASQQGPKMDDAARTHIHLADSQPDAPIGCLHTLLVFEMLVKKPLRL
jgi:hypothetical protein